VKPRHRKGRVFEAVIKIERNLFLQLGLIIKRREEKKQQAPVSL
jgi:hypothetical protein